MVRYQPRRWLGNPALFGRDPDAETLPASEDPHLEGMRQTAVIQHRFACQMRARLGVDDQGHGDRDLLDRLYETPDHVYRKLRGETRMQLDQMYAWAVIAGIPLDVLNIAPAAVEQATPTPAAARRKPAAKPKTEPTTLSLFDLDEG